MRVGVLYAIGAYVLWGLFPVYWKALRAVPAHEILCHRMTWSLLFVLGLLAVKNHWRWLGDAPRSRKTVLTFFGTASLLALNWFTYIWAVNHDYIVECSLGYFVNPLFSVFLGMVFLHERLRRWQWVAIAIAAAGVLYLTFVYGSFPWISLTLALTFGLYGLIRKTADLDALEGLTLETAILFLPALAYLLHLEAVGAGSFGHAGARTNVLLAFTGVATALPLLWFAHGARRITLTSVGLLHYIAPTLQFLLGVLVYHEPFTRTRLVGFSAVWLALAIYSVEGVRTRRGNAKARNAASS